MILAVLLSLATKQLEKKDNKDKKGNKDKDLGSLIADCGYWLLRWEDGQDGRKKKLSKCEL